VFSDDQPICEATVTALSRTAASFVKRAAAGERVIITRHGEPVAVIVGLRDALDGLLAGSERFALMRREAREQLAAGLTSELPGWPSTSG
jgi:prevent-host-death family protein